MWSETLRLLIVSLLSVSLSISADIRTKYLRRAENSSLELDCSSLASSSATFSWQKNNELISSASSLFEIEKSGGGGKLKILNGDKSEVYGNYSCRVGSTEVGKFRVVPMPLILLPKSKTVVEGETLELSCGEQLEVAARVRWVFANKTYEDSEEDGRLTLEDKDDVEGAYLEVKDIRRSDRGEVKCIVKIDGQEIEAKTFLRVKDKYAALWPFLGICAEVIVLMAIIIIYEKNRNKNEPEDSDTDQGTDTKNSETRESSVRQRK